MITLLAAIIATATIGNSPLNVRIDCAGTITEETITTTKTYSCTSAEVKWEPPTTMAPDEQHPLPWLPLDLAGFRIYWGTKSDQLFNVIDLPDANLRAYRVEGLKPGQTYYFAMTAYTSLREESLRSGIAWINL